MNILEKGVGILNKNRFKILIGLIFVFIIFTTYLKYANSAVETFALATASKVIVIDPGHGGFDPGKVGNTGSHEKDLNLKIALKVRDYLEQSGAIVVMTRTEDVDLDGDDSKQWKKEDMIQRAEKTNNSEADILVSIHQNSFPQPQVKGAQVFYHSNSDLGKLLAQNIQKSIKTYADTENKRVAKHNADYYLLRVTEIPAVIVECGFLTNAEEEAKLNTDAYQEEIAWSIYIGIIEYFQDDKSML